MIDNSIDPTLSKIIEALQPEDNLGVLLAAQVGGTPQEIQLIMQTTEFDEEKDALRANGQYIIRAVGVVEHRLALGLFNNIAFSTDNPLLYRHNETLYDVYFKGKPQNVDALMLDLNQLYGQTYGIFRHMAEEINRSRPLAALLTEGYGMLGQMPAPFAEKLKNLFARHEMQISLFESETHRPQIKFQLLVMDDSYLVAQLFSADPMKLSGKPEK